MAEDDAPGRSAAYFSKDAAAVRMMPPWHAPAVPGAGA